MRLFWNVVPVWDNITYNVYTIVDDQDVTRNRCLKTQKCNHDGAHAVSENRTKLYP